MNQYELTFLLPNEEELKSIKSIVETNSGKIVKEEKWGARKLAYPIKKGNSAHFFTWSVAMKADQVAELKKKLNFNEKLLRYLLLKVD